MDPERNPYNQTYPNQQPAGYGGFPPPQQPAGYGGFPPQQPGGFGGFPPQSGMSRYSISCFIFLFTLL